MFFLDPHNGTPLYVQLQHQLQQRILSGQIADGARLPSVRELAAELQINLLTVAKVFQLLERDGFVETRRGVGTFVSHQSPVLQKRARHRQIAAAVERLAVEALHLGLDETEVAGLLAEKFRQLTPRKSCGYRPINMAT